MTLCSSFIAWRPMIRVLTASSWPVSISHVSINYSGRKKRMLSPLNFNLSADQLDKMAAVRLRCPRLQSGFHWFCAGRKMELSAGGSMAGNVLLRRLVNG